MNGVRTASTVFAIGCLSLAGLAANQQSADARTAQVPLDGRSIFVAYCASCHGIDGKGHGPAAAALKATPIDLTTISKNNHRMFPRATIEDIVRSGGKLQAHGSKAMPVWGPTFREVSSNENVTTARVANVVAYIEAMQVK